MNDVFSFGRFAKLFRYECINYLPRHIKGMAVYSGMIVLLWLFTWTMNTEMTDRAPFVGFLFYVAVALAPYFVYGEFNHRKRGYNYAMLPASVLEKFLSMLLMCLVVIPVLTYLLLSFTDAALYCASYIGGGKFTGLVFYNPFTDDIFLMGNYNWLENILILTGTVSYIMMFNALFRRFKIVKSMIAHVLLTFLLQIGAFLTVLLFTFDFFDLSDIGLLLENYEGKTIYHALIVSFTLLSILVLQTIVYLRIKKVNY